MNQELHLLVVADQPVIQQIHITSLSQLGCRVTLAMNGEETHPLACKPFIQNHCRLNSGNTDVNDFSKHRLTYSGASSNFLNFSG